MIGETGHGGVTALWACGTIARMTGDDYQPNRRRRGPALSPSELEELRAQGYNLSQIARMRGVTRGRVSQIKMSNPLHHKDAKERAREHFPIKHPAPGAYYSFFFRRIRYHGEWRETSGKDMSFDKLNKLNNFWKKMRKENLIVVYDPERILPSEDSRFGCFEYATRSPEDGDLILRDNEFVQYDSISRELYRLPPA